METLTTNPEAQKEKLIQEIFKRPTVIGIEGGPCSGKTTFVESLKEIQANRSIVVLPEAAGIVAKQFQVRGIDIMAALQNDHNLKMQFEQEVLALTAKQINQAKEQYYGTDAVIVADRVDIGAYVQTDEYRQITRDIDLEEPPLVGMVDKILYFPTLAKKDPKKYMRLRDDNPTRRETVEQAVAVCDANFKAASIHPEFHYMDVGDFSQTLDAATAYVLNPENEYEKGGHLIGDLNEAENLIRIKESKGQLLVSTTVIQRYGQINGLNYRLRSELLGEVSSDYLKPTPVRYSISLKDKATSTELQRVISKREYDILFNRADDIVDKYRDRFLHKDPNGSVNVWSLDRVHSGSKDFGWIFEVESHDQKSLNELEPPFQLFAEKTHSNRDLPRIAIQLYDNEKHVPPRPTNPNHYNDDDIPTYIHRPW